MPAAALTTHLNPAIAMADRIMHVWSQAPEVLLWAPNGIIENKLVPAAGYSLKHVKIQGLRRSLSANIKTLWLALTSPWRRKIIREFKPDVAVPERTALYAGPLSVPQRGMRLPSAARVKRCVPPA